MKKILSILLIVCLTFSCFVACGEDDSKDSARKKPSKTTATVKPTATATATATVDGEDDTQGGDLSSGEIDPSEEPSATNDVVETPSASASNTAKPTTSASATKKPAASATQKPAPSKAPTSSGWETGIEDDFDPSINEDIDCRVFDFRGGEVAFEDLLYGYEFLNQPFNNCDVWGENGALNVSIFDEDPYFYFYNFEEFELQDYPIFKIVLKNNTEVDCYEMFMFEQGEQGEALGQKVISRPGMTKGDKEYKTYTMNFKKNSGDTTYAFHTDLDRTVSGIRIDCIGTGEKGTYTIGDDWFMEIAYFGFFKTIEDANAYK